VNIHIDKLGREAKTAKKDLDQLLGPAPEGSLGTIDLLATALPSVRPGGPAPAVAPPPSDFRFQDPSPAPSRKAPTRPAAPPSFPVASSPPAPPAFAPSPPAFAPSPPAFAHSSPASAPAFAPSPPAFAPSPPAFAPSPSRAQPPTPPGFPQAGPPPPPFQSQAPSASQYQRPMGAALGIDDDILGAGSGPASSAPEPGRPRIDPYFKQIFDQFVTMKRSCNEPTAGLVYEKFAEKLVKNREDLMMKTGCREVRFTVYVKDGKAALKATPVKDEA
jgi:hypothetical protein